MNTTNHSNVTGSVAAELEHPSIELEKNTKWHYMKNLLYFFMLLSANLYGNSLSRYYYLGDDKYELNIKSDNLNKLVGINPSSLISVKPNIVEVTALALKHFKDLRNIKNSHILDAMRMKKVGLTHICNTNQDQEVWLWEVSFESDGMGSKVQISIFVDQQGNLYIPKPVAKNAK